MKVPISWLKDFVEIQLPVEELAKQLTLAGLEVEEIRYVGLPGSDSKLEARPGGHLRREIYTSGLSWDPETIVVGAVLEVMPHPDADRLVLCRIDDGVQEHIVVTGAPNLFPYKDQGELDPVLKIAYAREGAVLFNGHEAGWELMKLKRAKIRGIESYSMACSEKELGISEDHEGVILLDENAPIGLPLVEYMGDAVLDIAITPNIARAANILGVATEVAAITDTELQVPDYTLNWTGEPIQGRVNIQIQEPELNPRFVLGLIEGIDIGPSPYWMQRRLRLAGMRPINNIVDATNYAMLEIGQPLHAFDYDILLERAGDETPIIITRLPHEGEMISTLDGVERELDEFNILVADSIGAVGLAGVMGGAETEVNDATKRILLEGASWRYSNIRRTVMAQNLPSEAAYRFERGVPPAMAERGVRRGLQLMNQFAGGAIAEGLVDAYPLPQVEPIVEITSVDVHRWLGIELTSQEIGSLLQRLGFAIEIDEPIIRATPPDTRLDIGEGVIGKADLMEEIARIYGYDRIPETQISDTIPPQYGNQMLAKEEAVRDVLVELDLQEVVTYRLTSKERQAKCLSDPTTLDPEEFIVLANPISPDRDVMRRHLLGNLVETVESNARRSQRIGLFEIGPVFLKRTEKQLPLELQRLAIAMTGQRTQMHWQGSDTSPLDFFDLKGIIVSLLQNLHVRDVTFKPGSHPVFHPGKCAALYHEDQLLGTLGELHPVVQSRYDLPESPLLAAELDLDVILSLITDRYPVLPLAQYPPVLEDLAVVVGASVTAEDVRTTILTSGGEIVVEVKLFDLYQGEQIEEDKKSLAFSVVYQHPERTLTDFEVAERRDKIVKQLETQFGAKLRS